MKKREPPEVRMPQYNQYNENNSEFLKRQTIKELIEGGIYI
jgi:hypothetical protein